MGLLAESKSRRKLNHDPNNTKWTRDVNRFGQKILRAQGWQPGEFLGAKDAPHSELHTSANASYIRVTLKDDMKGLGFGKRNEDEVAGLDDFSDLLSRLNGKSDAAVEEARRARLVVKMNAYVQSKYGPMRFVRGGLLVGDDLKEEGGPTETPAGNKETLPAKEGPESEGKKNKKSRKRKAASLEDDDEDDDKASTKDPEAKSKKQRKEGKKSNKRSAGTSPENSEEGGATKEEDSSKAKKKEKKSKSKDKAVSGGEDEAKQPTSILENSDPERPAKRKSKPRKGAAESSEGSGTDEATKSKNSKKERKEDKKAKKERKKEEKEEKKRKKREARQLTENASGVSSALPGSSASTAQSTPAGSGASTPRNPHLVRSRFLAAKREAMMNDTALDKIWMVKA